MRNPRVLAFICKWCARAAMESATVHGFEHSLDLQFIKLPCIGRIESMFIYRAFLDGFDGVMVFGCPERDCHYVQGNMVARSRLEKIHSALEMLGFEKERLKVIWLAANEIEKFRNSITSFASQLRNMGPNPLFSTEVGGGEAVNEY
ncbi:MAG: hydrogenase iron-sulfur subunit [Candidatus Helarchaeales archaeon]